MVSLMCGVPYVESCGILPCPFSDHCAVLSFILVPDVVPPGPGFRKLNTSILQNDEYVKLISDAWLNWRTSIHRFHSLAKWWEEGKGLIKGLTIHFCCSKTEARSRNRDLLIRLIDHLKSKVDAGSVSYLGLYHSALSELANLDSWAAKGAEVRPWIKWVEEGETSSVYFFRLVKKRSGDRWISALRKDDGSIVSSPVDLCSCLSDFYLSLFSTETTDSAVRSSLHPQVEECHTALQGMATSKAPGSDGLPMEFYLKFWNVLGADLVAVLNSCFDYGSLSLSQRRGVISLSLKKGGRLDPRNWRPIPLLNVDYKIASRVIVGHLLNVIHLVVDRDQTCEVPGRFIGENGALLRDVVDFAFFSDTPVAVLSLYQKKAFDRVDWSFMRATLSAMSFGSSFIAWVNLFYHRVQSSVNVNGYLSSYFWSLPGGEAGLYPVPPSICFGLRGTRS